MSTNVRWAALGLIVLTGLVAVFMTNVVGAIWDAIGLRSMNLVGQQISLSDLIGVGLALIAGMVVWARAHWRQVSVEIVAELRKVTWPGKEETRSSTIVVIIAVLIIAAILGTFDLFWSWFTDVIYAA